MGLRILWHPSIITSRFFMKNQLQKLEDRIRELVEIRLVGFLRGWKIEEKAIHQLSSAIIDGIIRNTDTSPNIYTIIFNPEDNTKWENPHFIATLRETILIIGREANRQYITPPTITIATDTAVLPGNVKVVLSTRIEKIEATNSITKELVSEPESSGFPENAFLIIEGKSLFPLTTAVINIGRRLENQLIIDDPRVSRTHAQLRFINGRPVIFDLNSTGGTFINGKRVTQTILYPGDIISLAGVNLVYGQDNPLPHLDIKDTNPLNSDPLDRKTAILESHTNLRDSNK